MKSGILKIVGGGKYEFKYRAAKGSEPQQALSESGKTN